MLFTWLFFPGCNASSRVELPFCSAYFLPASLKAVPLMTPALDITHTTTKLNHTYHACRGTHVYSPRLMELTMTSDDKVSECCLSTPMQDTYIIGDRNGSYGGEGHCTCSPFPPVPSPRPDTLLWCSGELLSPVTGDVLPLEVVP